MGNRKDWPGLCLVGKYPRKFSVSFNKKRQKMRFSLMQIFEEPLYVEIDLKVEDIKGTSFEEIKNKLKKIAVDFYQSEDFRKIEAEGGNLLSWD
jgi:hypothetical protein